MTVNKTHIGIANTTQTKPFSDSSIPVNVSLIPSLKEFTSPNINKPTATINTLIVKAQHVARPMINKNNKIAKIIIVNWLGHCVFLVHLPIAFESLQYNLEVDHESN